MRTSIVKRNLFFLASCCLALAGCGGGGGGGGYYSTPGAASGVILDQNGNVVRGATVSYSFGGVNNTVSTVSSSDGAYILKGLPAQVDLIQCQVVNNGVTYVGQNIAYLNSGAQTMSVNIAVYPSTQIASINGTVGDGLGHLIYGASVYAIPASGKALTSAYGITDNSGHYFIGGLLAGTAYKLQVNAQGYTSAFDTETLNAGENRSLSYSIAAASSTTLPTPTGVAAVAYTAPSEVTTQPKVKRAVEAIKNLLNPKRKPNVVGTIKPKFKRATLFGEDSTIEVDVTWNPITNTNLLGYGIYQSEGNAPLVNIDFLSDPLGSLYEDMYGGLASGTTYNYAVTTVSTSYTSTSGESPLSTSATVTPLGPLTLGSASTSTLPVFSWQAASGASTYVVYLFNQYPNIGVSDIYDNSTSPTTNTTFTYAGTPLTSGQTYYYIVVGQSASGSQSISTVGQFTVQ